MEKPLLGGEVEPRSEELHDFHKVVGSTGQDVNQ